MGTARCLELFSGDNASCWRCRLLFLHYGVVSADECRVYIAMFTQGRTCGGVCKVAKESASITSHQGLMDGQVPGSAKDEPTVNR